MNAIHQYLKGLNPLVAVTAATAINVLTVVFMAWAKPHWKREVFTSRLGLCLLGVAVTIFLTQILIIAAATKDGMGLAGAIGLVVAFVAVGALFFDCFELRRWPAKIEVVGLLAFIVAALAYQHVHGIEETKARAAAERQAGEAGQE
jgi:hypothetical protein